MEEIESVNSFDTLTCMNNDILLKINIESKLDNEKNLIIIHFLNGQNLAIQNHREIDSLVGKSLIRFYTVKQSCISYSKRYQNFEATNSMKIKFCIVDEYIIGEIR